MILETERLRLRPLTLADAWKVRPLLDDLSISAELPAVAYPLHESECQEWIRSACEDETFAVERRCDGALVAAIGLHLEPGERGQVGGWVGRPYRHNGYAVEAMRAVVRYGYSVRKLRLLYALRKGRLWIAFPDSAGEEHMPFHPAPDAWHLLDLVDEA